MPIEVVHEIPVDSKKARTIEKVASVSYLKKVGGAYFPKPWVGEKLPTKFRDYFDVCDVVTNLDFWETGILSYLISKRCGKDYFLPPLGVSCNLVHTNPTFRELTKGGMNNSEFIKKGRDGMCEIFPRLRVKKTGGHYKFCGRSIETEIDESGDIFAIFVKAGLMKEPKLKISRGGFYIEKGEAFVCSMYYYDERLFSASTHAPLERSGSVFAVFVDDNELTEDFAAYRLPATAHTVV